MPDGRKPILSPLTGRKEQKAWNKTREKYMPVKRRQNQLKQTDDHITKRYGQKTFQTVKVNFTMVMNVIMMKIMNIAVTRGFSQQMLQNSFTILLQKVIKQ